MATSMHAPVPPDDLELAFQLATERACRITDLTQRRRRLEALLESRGRARRLRSLPFDARALEAWRQAERLDPTAGLGP